MTRKLLDQPLDLLEQRFQALRKRAGGLPQASRQELEPALQDLFQAIAALQAARGSLPAEAPDGPAEDVFPAPAEAIFQNIFSAIPDLLTVIDRDFNIVMSNWHDSALVPEEARRGRPKCYRAYHHRDRPCEPCHVQEVFRTGRPQKTKKTNRLDGRTREFSAFPVLNKAGRVILAAESVRDVTGRCQAEKALRASEARFRTLVEDNPESLFLTDVQGIILAASRMAARRVGKNLEEIIGTSAFDHVPPEVAARRRDFAGQVLASGRPVRFEDSRDNFHFDIHINPILDAQGKVSLLSFLAIDIADRKQAERALQESEERFRMLFEYAPDAYILADAQGEIIDCNKATEELAGYGREELIGNNFACLPWLDSRQQVRLADLLAQTARGEIMGPVDFTLIHKGGTEVIAEGMSLPLFIQGQNLVLTIIRDITARNQAEAALALHAVRIQALLDLHLLRQAPQEQILDFVLEASLKTTQSEYAFFGTIDAAESVMTIHRWSQEVMQQCTIVDKPFQCPISEAGLWGECLRQQKAWLCNEYQAPHPGKKGLPAGHVPIRRFLAVPVLGGGRLVAACLVANKPGDYTEEDVNAFTTLMNTTWEMISRRRAEEELRDSEQRFRLMAESVQDVFWLCTPDLRRVIYLSPAFGQIWGRSPEDLYGAPRTFIEAVHPEDRERVRAGMLAASAQGTTWSHEYRIVKPDEAVRWVQDRGYPVRDDQGRVVMFTGVARDITGRKSLEQQLFQAQKMEAVGRLAGGVAHDFNNLLMAITGYGELIRGKVLKDDPLYGHLENILKAADRATALTQQLLTFSRRQIIHPQLIDLNQVVVELEPMLRRLIGEDLDLEVAIEPGAVVVKADPGQLGQIIMNLVVNARDAMPTGGQLTVKAASVNFTACGHSRFGLTPPGAYATLMVRDTGVGMDEATQSHAFEPFFTTKEPGKGTGLGLSTVYGIVRQSGGYLDLVSAPGAGSAFTIYLPRLDVAVEPPRAKIPITASFRGEETILLVEDEDQLRGLLAKFLRLYGYSVLEARHGGEALLTCERHQGRIHLMVTDVVMPQMSGRELADRLLPLRPDMKILYMSGYTEDALFQHGVADPAVTFLQKPFKPIELARQVHAALHIPPGR
jgi:two-component system, cell cycle sensor histidine kinase and response regulator CckA